MKMLEIKLKSDDDFLKIKETLTRMGIANNKDRVLYQSCHILQKQGLYYIVHFKELLQLDGRQVDITVEDELRRNNIAKCLSDWNMCDIVGTHRFNTENHFRIISFKEKENWKLVSKYRIGK
ncbi:MAG: translational repressor RegA [Cetobacterium sp.]|uniref:translational repressor RegA n=1 Tax=Cetobacterium sp. TaxID=2071632 RepID=UPI003EE6DDC2